MSLYLLNVTVHVLAALLWLGGMFFLAVVGAPILREVEPPDLRARLFQRLGVRFRSVGWACIAVLLLTGVGNLYFRGVLRPAKAMLSIWATPFGHTLAWKLVAVAAMIVVSVLHDFVLGPAAARAPARTDRARRYRVGATWLARVNAVLGVMVVILAVRLARGG
jgi:copper resistance protein D